MELIEVECRVRYLFLEQATWAQSIVQSRGSCFIFYAVTAAAWPATTGIEGGQSYSLGMASRYCQ